MSEKPSSFEEMNKNMTIDDLDRFFRSRGIIWPGHGSRQIAAELIRTGRIDPEEYVVWTYNDDGREFKDYSE